MFLRFMMIALLCATLALGVFSYAMGRSDGLLTAIMGVTALSIACRGLFSEQARRARERALPGRTDADRAKAVKLAHAAAKRSKAAPALKAPVKPVVRKRHVSRHAPPRRPAARRAQLTS